MEVVVNLEVSVYNIKRMECNNSGEVCYIVCYCVLLFLICLLEVYVLYCKNWESNNWGKGRGERGEGREW